MNIPTTCEELYQAADLPFHEGNRLISMANKELVVQCFTRIYPKFGFGYLHSSDHYAALQILLGREPTFREVYDSYHSGSEKIDAARQKMGGGQRPSGWDDWTEQQRRYAVLVEIHGVNAGSRIFDGKRPDPSPEKTRNLQRLWGMNMLPVGLSAPSSTSSGARITVQGEVVITEADGTERRIPFKGGDA